MSEAITKPAMNLVLNPSRRQFAALGAVAAVCSGHAVAAPLASHAMSRKTGTLKVKIEGNLFRPQVGEHPGLVMYASAAATKSANAAVAQQLASEGWAVLLVEAGLTDDPLRIAVDTRAHVGWLISQNGVSASGTDNDKMHGFVLRNFSAAQPMLSMASREKRQCAATCNILFAAPKALLAKDKARTESLSSAARAIYRRAA